jgi:hypothetical protein
MGVVARAVVRANMPVDFGYISRGMPSNTAARRLRIRHPEAHA